MKYRPVSSTAHRPGPPDSSVGRWPSPCFWQTTTITLVGTVIGVPAGMAVGRLIWRAFASNLGVLPVPVVTDWQIVMVAAGTILAANVLAIGPAVAASRTLPASLLRAE